jgi:hypothetical protein
MHGLATTGAETVKACDWFSVDSASWVMLGAMGKIATPYKNWMRPLQVSWESPKVKELGAHIDNMTLAEVQMFNEFVESYGYLMSDLRDSHGHRKAFNLLVLQDLIEKVIPPPHREQGLF